MIKRTFKATNAFKRDLKKHYLTLIEEHWAMVITCLANDTPIPERYQDHPLHGDKNGFRDCHIKPDLVLIYKINGNVIELHRLGTHSEIFG